MGADLRGSGSLHGSRLAFFYAGLVRGSSALVMLQQNLVPLGLVSITWVVFGYSFAFSGDWGSGFLGDLKLFGLQDIHTAAAPGFHLIEGAVAVPTLAFVVYQMMFAIITPALITGATANRLKPLGWAVLLVLWSIIVYPPIAHWLFNPEGWLALRGAQDWAGELSSTHPPAPPPWQSCWWSVNVRDGQRRGSPALGASGVDRRRHPVVRLVRIQRRRRIGRR